MTDRLPTIISSVTTVVNNYVKGEKMTLCQFDLAVQDVLVLIGEPGCSVSRMLINGMARDEGNDKEEEL